MNGPNHIVGGLAFTGIFASFFDVNIFHSSGYLFLTIFGSLLPDIDHTKSIIGKSFYPIAKWLDRKHGHRTITHSLIFLFAITGIYATFENAFFNQTSTTIILFFSVFSHLILDMVTVQGIPLFYPFFKNPCVIPANASSRIRNSDVRAQAIVFFMFSFVLFTCQDLFANGFWTSYNRAFGTIKHVYAESMTNKNNILFVEFSYNKNGKIIKGKAELIKSTANELILFNWEDKVFKLDKESSVNYTRPIKTKSPRIVNQLSFFNINLDSLLKITHNKIISGNIQSSEPIIILDKNIKTNKDKIELDLSFNPIFTVFKDTSSQIIKDKIKELKIRLNQINSKRNIALAELKYLKQSENNLINDISITKDIYLENDYRKDLIEIQKKIKNYKVPEYSNNALISFEIATLQHRMKFKTEIKFNGMIEIITPIQTVKKITTQ